MSSGNTFVETSISVVPVCHHLAETVYFSLPLKLNWKFPIYWIVLKWTWLLLRLPFFPARRPNRQGWNLTMIGILFLIKYAANHSPFVEEWNPSFWHIPRFSLLICFVFPAAPISVNPTPPPLVVFLSPLLLISPTSPCVCWCLCFLIFNFGLRSSSVWFFFSLLFQSETFLVFSPFTILQFFFYHLLLGFILWVVLYTSLFQYLQFYITLTAGIASLSHSLAHCDSVGALRTVFMGEAGG